VLEASPAARSPFATWSAKSCPRAAFSNRVCPMTGGALLSSFVACPPSRPLDRPAGERGRRRKRLLPHLRIGVDGSGLRQLTTGCYDDMMPCYLPDGPGLCLDAAPQLLAVFWAELQQSLAQLHASPDERRRQQAAHPLTLTTSVNGSPRWRTAARSCSRAGTTSTATPLRTRTCGPCGRRQQPDCGLGQRHARSRIAPSKRKRSPAAARSSSSRRRITQSPPGRCACSIRPWTRTAWMPVTRNHTRAVPRGGEQPHPGVLQCSLAAVGTALPRRVQSRAVDFRRRAPAQPEPRQRTWPLPARRAGNRELLYRDPQISSTTPIPLTPLPLPHTLPTTLSRDAPHTGEMLITDVYQGLGNVPRGTIKQLRVIQIFPKTTWLVNSPRIGIAGEENSRAILGAVPSRPTGRRGLSCRRTKPILFQALDQDGFAYQTMRSTTSVQPGERTACVGCHEHRMSAPPKMAGIPWRCGVRPRRWTRANWAVGRSRMSRSFSRCSTGTALRCHGGEKTEKGVDLTAAPHKRLHQVVLGVVYQRRRQGSQRHVAAPCAAVRATQPDPDDAARRPIRRARQPADEVGPCRPRGRETRRQRPAPAGGLDRLQRRILRLVRSGRAGQTTGGTTHHHARACSKPQTTRFFPTSALHGKETMNQSRNRHNVGGRM